MIHGTSGKLQIGLDREKVRKTYPGDVPLHIAEASVTVVLKIPFFILKNIPFIELGRGIPALNASHCGQGKEATKKGEDY